MFPSPYGDYGSDQHFLRTGKRLTMFLFPSPYGDYGSYQER